jgi:hypothetical protein
MARDAIEQVDLTLRLVESYPEAFQLITGPSEVKDVYASGKIACSIGIEGLHMAGNSIGIIRAFYRLGVRYVWKIDLIGLRLHTEFNSALSLTFATMPLRIALLQRSDRFTVGYPT